MLLNASVTVAYKCPACGTFEFFDGISIFELLHKKKNDMACKCGHSAVNLLSDGINKLYISVPCISCEGTHYFYVSRKALLHNEVNTFICPEKGIKLCFVGNDEAVRSRIDYFEKELDELINTFGYENYFNNTQVMLDSLNHLHDIAEKGELCCECGKGDIEVTLLPDRILLKCRDCSATKELFAASNVNLKDIMARNKITLAKVSPDMDDIRF